MKIDQNLPSPALGKDLIYNIYLPDVGSSESRLPVVYLLHGLGGGRHEWRRDGRVADTLDRLIAAGELAPLIAVMPEAGKMIPKIKLSGYPRTPRQRPMINRI